MTDPVLKNPPRDFKHRPRGRPQTAYRETAQGLQKLWRRDGAWTTEEPPRGAVVDPLRRNP